MLSCCLTKRLWYGSYNNQMGNGNDLLQERNLRFGVREHGMGAICNGIALHTKGLIPYCATFFIFTDYMRSAIRMSALSEAGGRPTNFVTSLLLS